MNDVFADTSYYVALLGERDQHHAKAVDLARACDGQTITTDFVLMEVGNWLSQTADRPLFLLRPSLPFPRITQNAATLILTAMT